jgi:Proteasome subunit
MTTCVAAICGGSKAIVLVADKMLGFGHVEAAIGEKILRLHMNWHVLYAGNDISPAFPIVDRASAALQDNRRPTLLDVAAALSGAWKAERDARTEAKVFAGRVGWTLERFFNEGRDHFSASEVTRLTSEIEMEELDLELMIAGFDERKRPFILSMDSSGHSIPEHRPGCWTIGSGAPNALTFLSWREVKPLMPVRGALAFAVEAKYYGELAAGVSAETDVIIIQPDKADIVLKEADVEDKLFERIAIKNKPKLLDPEQLDILNGMKELAGVPFVWSDKEGRLIETEKRRKPPRSARKENADNVIELAQQSPQSPKGDP